MATRHDRATVTTMKSVSVNGLPRRQEGAARAPADTRGREDAQPTTNPRQAYQAQALVRMTRRTPFAPSRKSERDAKNPLRVPPHHLPAGPWDPPTTKRKNKKGRQQSEGPTTSSEFEELSATRALARHLRIGPPLTWALRCVFCAQAAKRRGGAYSGNFT